MSEQTAGPWLEIEEHQASSEWYAAAIHVGSPFDGSLRTLARIPQADPHWDAEAVERTLAEARVMAAAPELMAALRAMLDAMDVPAMDRAMALAEAAIAKATGQTTAVPA